METAPEKPGPRPVLSLLAFAGVIGIALGAWYLSRSPRPSDVVVAAPVGPVSPAPRPGPPPARPQGRPPAPPVPENVLVLAPAPIVAPSFALPTIEGGRVDLAALRGQVVVVNFWATWCPPCAAEMPSMVALGEALAKAHPGKFKLVAVSVDQSAQLVKDFFGKAPYRGVPKGLSWALEPGAGEVTRTYYCVGRGACSPNEVAFPETYIVDRKGRLVSFVVGPIDWSEPALRAHLESLISG